MASSRRAIGLLAEKYSKWERRAALTPSHVQRFVKSGIDVLVQPSTSRVYADSEYSNAGAVLTSDLSDASAIFGVKQPVNGRSSPERRTWSSPTSSKRSRRTWRCLMSCSTSAAG